MKKSKIFILILLVIILLGIIFFAFDYNKVKNGEKPSFCIKSAAYLDGGTVEYLGIGYKVIDFHKMLPLNDGDAELKYYDDIKIGTWFMNYDDFKNEYDKNLNTENTTHSDSSDTNIHATDVSNNNNNNTTQVIGQTFYATIEKIYDSKFLVKGLEVNDINHRGEFYISISENTELTWRGTKLEISDFNVGNNISITYDGSVLETYPAKILNVFRIQLLDDEFEKE